jgi:HK97 family phage prohead protease
MKYSRYITAITSRPWAIHPQKGEVIASLIAERANGAHPTADEVRTRLGHDGLPRPEVRYLAATGRSGSGRTSEGGKIAVVPIHGVVAHRADSFELSSGGVSTEWIAAVAARLADDDAVVGVVLDVDSPGGSTEGLQVAADALYRLGQRKTLVAAVNSNAASAAYWLASQAGSIAIEPNGSAGSIGVFMIALDQTKYLEKEGVKVDVIKFGANKIEGHPFEAMSAETRAHFQSEVNRIGAQFHAAVARGRRVSSDRVADGFGNGRYFAADQAVSRGLVDRVATLDQVVSELVQGRTSGSGGRGGTGAAAAAAMQKTIALEIELLELGPTPQASTRPTRKSPCSFVLRGIAAPFNQFGSLPEGGRRVVLPGALDAYLAAGRQPKMLVNHDPSRVIEGRFESLEAQADGLAFVFRPDEGSEARRLAAIAQQHGNLGVSIGPRAVESFFNPYHRVGGHQRAGGAELYSEVALDEISILTEERSPAFRGAWAEVRYDA